MAERKVHIRKKVATTIHLDPDVYDNLIEYAQRNNRTMSASAALLIEDGLKTDATAEAQIADLERSKSKR